MHIDPSATTDDLLGPMVKLKLFVVLWKAKGLELHSRLRDHLEYMIHLEQQGRLFASGPLGAAGSGDGMTILRANSLAEANDIARQDPFVKAHLRDFEVQSWTLMEGSLHFVVNLSNTTVRFS